MATSLETQSPSFPAPYYSRGLREKYHLDALRTPIDRTPEAKNYADINYEANEEKYHARTARRLAAGGLETEVPAGWPKTLNHPLVWSGSDFPSENEYVVALTEKEKEEVADALKYLKKQGLEGDEVDRDRFPLPTLGRRLEKVRDDIYEGRGFSIIRGLEPNDFSVEDFTVVYLGITSYVAEKRGKQDQRGSMLMHVLKKKYDDDRFKNNLDKPFHTDTVCDCLCLVTRSCSAEGGRSILASAWKVYNELAATRPDLIHTLANADWPFDTYGREPPFYKRAAAFESAGKIIFEFSRRLLVGHAPTWTRTKGIPGLTEAQAEALDAIHFIARKHEIKTRMQRGDIRLINNMAILHRREAFEDTGSEKRHPVRVWLNNEEYCWKLPTPLRLAWARVFEDREREEHWDLDPPRKDGHLLRVAGSCD